MNLKKALMLGIAFWVVIFFEVSILMFGFGLKGTAYYIIHYALAGIFLIIASILYFKKKGNIREGLILGTVFIVVGIILDSIITVPLFVHNYSSFFNNSMLAGYIETLVITTIFGALRR
jgi:hypothetical protein